MSLWSRLPRSPGLSRSVAGLSFLQALQTLHARVCPPGGLLGRYGRGSHGSLCPWHGT